MWRWDNQEPFGDDTPNEDPGNTGMSFSFPMRFRGQYYDAETNTAYNYYRDYDPGVGRYVQSDPIGLRGGLNTYVYVAANPALLIDPSGRFCLSPREIAILSGAAGGLAGGVITGLRAENIPAAIALGVLGSAAGGAAAFATTPGEGTTMLTTGAATAMSGMTNPWTAGFGGLVAASSRCASEARHLQSPDQRWVGKIRFPQVGSIEFLLTLREQAA